MTLPDDIRSLPIALRKTARRCIPDRAFLRRDRGGALFVSNAPAYAETSAWLSRLQQEGFHCKSDGALLRIFPSPGLIAALELSHPVPPDHLCETLLRFRGQPPCEEASALFCTGVQLLENADPGRLGDYFKRTRQLAALCLRKNEGGAYACALIANALQSERSNLP